MFTKNFQNRILEIILITAKNQFFILALKKEYSYINNIFSGLIININIGMKV